MLHKRIKTEIAASLLKSMDEGVFESIEDCMIAGEWIIDAFRSIYVTVDHIPELTEFPIFECFVKHKSLTRSRKYHPNRFAWDIFNDDDAARKLKLTRRTFGVVIMIVDKGEVLTRLEYAIPRNLHEAFTSKDWKDAKKEVEITSVTSDAQQYEGSMIECNACGKGGRLKICSGCKFAWYCSPECQRDNWAYHKTKCQGYQLATKTCKNK